ncbi:hypothetical protein BCM20_004997 [Clostridium beijerinckii]|uniref:hypothetical protein n=2 Tax=Clostridium beijerinckii TaxID=1520 RepID=UPI0017CF2E8C|nr:hypothetical protein [Clostridium beijerinckii]NOW07235.1 hypothetical protein [Clostridium beijerinckii]NYC04991.1 hypothetical protein [Clostridium beijerinckii]
MSFYKVDLDVKETSLLYLNKGGNLHMAHQLQERYSNMVLKKLRQTLVTKDEVIFNNSYEGDPKAGLVKIPVRGEVNVKKYDKVKGVPLDEGSTTYMDLLIDKDEVVNELIDGYDAQAVPDGIVADRIDSAGYGLGLSVDTQSINALESQGTVYTTVTASTKSNIYSTILDIGAKMTRAGVPVQGRWLIVSPETKALILKSDEFIKAGDLSQQIVQTGAFGAIAGFNCYESGNTMFGNTTVVTGKTVTTEFIAGHPLFASRVMEFKVPVHVQDLAQSGTYIGACAVQGRQVWGVKVTRPEAIYVKRIEA